MRFSPLPVADAGDHGGVVLLVRKDDATRQQLGQRRQRRVVGDVGGGEQQRRFLAVQVGELGLQLDVIVGRAGNVAGAARAGADRVDRLVHGGDHGGMLTHAEIVVGAPHGDRAGLGTREVLGRRKRAAAPLQIGKDTIAPFTMNGVQSVLQLTGVVHQASSTPPAVLSLLISFKFPRLFGVLFGCLVAIPGRHLMRASCAIGLQRSYVIGLTMMDGGVPKVPRYEGPVRINGFACY